MDQREVTLLVLLDLSAAFDTVDHEIMLELLKSNFGVSGDALGWLKSFLSDRKQFVSVNQVLSNSFPVTCGVPQGSCLGPILFLFYVSKLFEIIKKHLPSSHGYADDTQLYLSFCPESPVCQNDAVKVVEACITETSNRAGPRLNRSVLDFRRGDFDADGLRSALQAINLSTIIQQDSNINEDWLLWKDTFLTTVKDFVPSRKIKGRNSPSWLNSKVIHALRQKEAV
ncbi:Hypothetical predicted protein [Paramuricea clavata]|uniref:Uncharacterized protein n=1 Tax=Paramuricea clavata TaxID=317549 RepID=A0A7D9LKJ2_PARCT|nr:Hypothetical predicted protein [Paramuricea clavata]